MITILHLHYIIIFVADKVLVNGGPSDINSYVLSCYLFITSPTFSTCCSGNRLHVLEGWQISIAHNLSG